MSPTTDDPRCIATTAKGKPCRNPPMPGRQVCKQHTRDENVGRRSTLPDTNVRARLLLRLQNGCTIKDACASTGIDERTYYRWMETGEADEQHDRDTPERQFRQDATQARAEARVVAVSTLRQAMQPFTRTTRKSRAGQLVEETVEIVQPDWRAALAFLERTDPENWGRRDRIDATVRTPDTARTCRTCRTSRWSSSSSSSPPPPRTGSRCPHVGRGRRACRRGTR